MRRIFACLAIAACAFAQKRAITETDLYAFKWIADPRISPNGAEVAYVQVIVTPKHDSYQTSLWIVPAAGGSPRQLTSGTHDASPRWSPDGKRLAFLRSPEKDSKPEPPQIFLLDMAGGDARPLTASPKGAGTPVWSPTGHSIAFTSTSQPKDSEGKQDEDKSDVRIINRARYRANGEGYIDYDRPGHIWTVEVPATAASPVKARQITSGIYDERSPVWSKDESKIYFSADRDPEPYYQNPQTDIYSVAVAGGPIEKLVHVEGPVGSFSLSPDGHRITFVSALQTKPVRSYNQPDLFVSELTPAATPKNLTSSYDFDIESSIGGDQAPPRGNSPSLPYWSADGHYIFVTSAEKGRSNLRRINAETGELKSITEGAHDIYAYNATPDASKAALVISTPTNIGDVFVLDGASEPRRITSVNQELFSQLDLPEPEEFSYKSFDGKLIQGFIQRPPNFDASRKYPLILNIHGGPHSAYGYAFFHEMQWMAAKGYVVLYPNPRGSTTFGQDFGNIIQYKYPGDDYKDLMAGVDAVIAKGYVDPARTGVTGGSGGGILTNWTITQTNRFKAAVAQRSIADWTDFWYTTDFTLFTPTWFRGAPWQEPADFKARSPITYVDRIQTPLMLVEGEVDFRCPPAAGGEQMFRALKYLKKPVVMIQFPGESHELSRSGKPVHRIERLRHIVNWFDKYLQDKPMPMYDIPLADD